MKRVTGVLVCTLCMVMSAYAQKVTKVVTNGKVVAPITNVGGDVGQANIVGNQGIDFGKDNTVKNSPVNQTTNYLQGSTASSISYGSSAYGGTAYGGTAYGGSAQGGSGYGGSGGSSDAQSSASVNVNYKDRTGLAYPMSPYLPYWNHGGWGRSDAFFANGPNADKSVYERSYNPRDPEDMDQLRHTLEAVPYRGLLSILPGVFNQIGMVFGAPDNYHHGRGFQISNSLMRDRRPKGKPLMVLYTDDIDRRVFKKASYEYVGKVSIEGHQSRNWDQVYCAAVAEVLPWNVDVVIIDGGRKGVSVGSNSSFPSAGAGFSQTNYSLSLLGGLSSGVTEAKGKPIISVEAYRYSPRLSFKRSISRQFYSSLRSRFPELEQQRPVSYGNPTGGTQGIHVRPEMLNMAGFAPNQKVDCMSVPQVRQ